MAAYLCLNYVPGDATMLRGVRRLRQGTWRLWTAAGDARTGTYWQPPDPEEPDLALSDAQALERLEALLDSSTRLALRSDVPVGILLSGGIDSSLVARAPRDRAGSRRPTASTFAEDGYSEWPKAERTARTSSGVPLFEVRLDPTAIGDFMKLVEHADDPLADSSALAVWTLARDVAAQPQGGLERRRGRRAVRRLPHLSGDAVARDPDVAAAHALRRLTARLGSRLPTSERKVSTSFKLRRFLRAADLPPAIAHFTWNGTWLPEEAAGSSPTPAAGALLPARRLRGSPPLTSAGSSDTAATCRRPTSASTCQTTSWPSRTG